MGYAQDFLTKVAKANQDASNQVAAATAAQNAPDAPPPGAGLPVGGPQDTKYLGYYINPAGELVDLNGTVILNANEVVAQRVPVGTLEHVNATGDVIDANGNVTTTHDQVVANRAAHPDGGVVSNVSNSASGAADAATDPRNVVPLVTGGAVSPQDVTNVEKAAGDLPGAAADVVGKAVKDLGIGGDSPATGSAATDEVTRANNLADVLEGERQKAGTQADVDRGKGDETRDLQYQSVRDLQDAAAGRVPSAAELALTRQSGIDASRQFGLAAALQGNNPAAALRQASMGAAQVAGDTSSNAAILRAKEQADARSALANTLGNVRNQDNGAVNTDVTQQGNAQSGETTSQGQGVTAEGNVLNAETERDKAKKTLEGAEISAVGAGLGGLLTKSDERAKKNISRASLADALADGVHGVTFEYRRPDSGEDGSKHFGLLAQELERIVPGVVKPNADGVKMVDAGHLTMGNTAILAELAKRIQELEKGARK